MRRIADRVDNPATRCERAIMAKLVTRDQKDLVDVLFNLPERNGTIYVFNSGYLDTDGSYHIGLEDLPYFENSLAQKYNVSRATLRKALEILKNEGLIEKSQGKRVQITLSKLKRTSWNFSSFSEGLRAMHDEPYSRVDVNEIVQDKNNGEEFFHLKRTRGIKRGENIQYLTQEDSYVPLSLFPNINQHDFAKESLYEVMRKD